MIQAYKYSTESFIYGNKMKKFFKVSLLAALAFAASLLPAFGSAAAETAAPQTASPAASQSASQSASSSLQLDAKTAVVLDADNMRILYDKDMHGRMYPASITKIMTGLLAAENGSAADVVTITADISNAQGKSVACIGLEPGENITQDSLMYTMFLASANDSAYALAEHIGGTVENFVAMMNSRAEKAGAQGTHFSNPNGLPDVNNYTTAYDMALITKQAIDNETELRYFGATKQIIPADNVLKSCQYGTLVNMLRPDSMYYYKGIIAAKSGWTVMSSYTLVTAAKRDGRTMICAEMGGTSWDGVYRGASALMDYGFSQPSGSGEAVVLPSSSASGKLTSASEPAGTRVSKAAAGIGLGGSSRAVLIACAAGLAVICAAAVIIRKKNGVSGNRARRKKRY
jgi:D-alanyl-D-alanine carboxypeptidase (penicillin-binding protein 5/6)